jgi:hypothetical protein
VDLTGPSALYLDEAGDLYVANWGSTDSEDYVAVFDNISSRAEGPMSADRKLTGTSLGPWLGDIAVDLSRQCSQLGQGPGDRSAEAGQKSTTGDVLHTGRGAAVSLYILIYGIFTCLRFSKAYCHRQSVSKWVSIHAEDGTTFRSTGVMFFRLSRTRVRPGYVRYVHPGLTMYTICDKLDS